MNSSLGSSGSRIEISGKIESSSDERISVKDITNEQLALIEETIELIMLKKFRKISLDEESEEASPGTPQNFEKNSAYKINSIEQENLIISVTESQEKICRCLYDIQCHLQRDISFENDEDDQAQRRLKRFHEFTTRLSRNYLYQVSYVMQEIPSTNIRKLFVKTNQLYTDIYHALRFYCNNMINYNNKMQKKKLRETIEIIMKALRISVKERIFDEDDELIERISEMCSEILSECDRSDIPKTAPVRRTPKPKSKPIRRSAKKLNPLVMYLPQQQTAKKTKIPPKFHLNLSASTDDDETPEGEKKSVSRESSTEHLNTVTADDQLTKSVEKTQFTSSSTYSTTTTTNSTRGRSQLLQQRRKVRRDFSSRPQKDRASAHDLLLREISMLNGEENQQSQDHQQNRRERGKRHLSLESIYSEIGREVVDMVGDHSLKSVFL